MAGPIPNYQLRGPRVSVVGVVQNTSPNPGTVQRKSRSWQRFRLISTYQTPEIVGLVVVCNGELAISRRRPKTQMFIWRTVSVCVPTSFPATMSGET